MIRRFASLALLLSLAPLAARAQDAPKSITILDDKDLTIRLLVRPQATLAARDFLQLECVNKTGAEITLENAGYGIDYQSFDLVKATPAASGSLAGGNYREVLGQQRGSPVIIPRGTTTNIEQISNYGALALGAAPPQGLRIQAHLKLFIKLPGEAATRGAASDFEFLWLQPDAAGMDALRKELTLLLTQKAPSDANGQFINALLRLPDLAKDVPTGDYVKALGTLNGPFAGRSAVVKYLAEQRASEPAVLDYYRARLAARDREIVDELCYAAMDIWDERFVAPLVDTILATTDNSIMDHALVILDRHAAIWQSNKETRESLSAYILKLYPGLKNVAPGRGRPADAITFLGYTHDPAMAELLRPMLSDKTVTHDFQGDAMVGRNQSVAPIRVCDLAFNAMLTLQNKPKDRIEFRYWDRPQSLTAEAELARRDTLIENLRAGTTRP